MDLMGLDTYKTALSLVSRYKTRDPFEIMECRHVIVEESDRFSSLKGFCMISNRIVYAILNENLPDEEKNIVAAHELGHIVLHRQQLQMAPMRDSILFTMKSRCEYEANLFTADLLIEDTDVESLIRDEGLDYFTLCGKLGTSPDLMAFKMYSMIKRGYNYSLPADLNSRFLAKD